MIRISFIIVACMVLVGCKSNDCVPTVKTIEVKVPVNRPAPSEIVNLPTLQRPPLDIDSPEFKNATSYDTMSKSILQSVNALETYIEQLESRNRVYKNYIDGLPKEEK